MIQLSLVAHSSVISAWKTAPIISTMLTYHKENIAMMALT